ncbi:MAG TPA: hypothetical protein VKG80_16860 [Trebonia sp.]|nr:hypothetical protein [Trebonia sp.]
MHAEIRRGLTDVREGRRAVGVVGANNEADAQEIADQISREAPPGATVRAEHSRVNLPFMGF